MPGQTNPEPDKCETRWIDRISGMSGDFCLTHDRLSIYCRYALEKLCTEMGDARIKELDNTLRARDEELTALKAFCAEMERLKDKACEEMAIEERWRIFPAELTPMLREVLGQMVFNTGPLAQVFRDAGHEIPRKAEDEQAYVLHQLVLLVLAHGEGWRNGLKPVFDKAEDRTTEEK